jgi:hypothetical protein
MAGLVKTNIQLGDSATATQNFTLTVPAAPDGTLKLARGNAGATTQDILTVDAAGNVVDVVNPKAALAGSASQAFSASNFTTAQGLAFPATQNPSADPNTMDDYEEGTFTGTLVGCTTSPTLAFRYVKAGKLVTITPGGGGLTGTSNSSSKSITGMPSTLFPSVYLRTIFPVSDNGGAQTAGMVRVEDDGSIAMYANLTGQGFTASGTFTTYPVSFSYSI